MNKRIKKKRELEGKIKCLETMLDYAIREIIRQDKEIEELKQVSSRNAQATNSRFDKIEKQVANGNTKKPFWKTVRRGLCDTGKSQLLSMQYDGTVKTILMSSD
ncbi:hypothetical protein ACS6ZB_05005 [Streptococcus suis]